jgi:hypothetical protein
VSQENTEVTIWASQMQSGGLPAICAKTGEPADRWTRLTFRTPPAWANALLVAGVVLGGVGLVVALLVRNAVSPRATGRLPFTSSIATRIRVCSIGGTIALLAGLVLVLVGALAGSGTLAAVGGVLFVVGLVLLIVLGRTLPRAVVRKDPGTPNDRVVVLRRVHPQFVQGVLAQQHGSGAQQASLQAPAWTAGAR